MGSFELIEEVINSVFGMLYFPHQFGPSLAQSIPVFIIRFAERRIDQLLDSTILDYAPSSLDSVQFESEWSFLRSLTGRKKATAPSPISHSNSNTNINIRSPTAPPSPGRSLSSPQSQSAVPSKKPSSLKQTLSKKQPSTPLNLFFPDGPQVPSPVDLTLFLSALHSFLVMSDVNPALITQLWSQVFYWTACRRPLSSISVP
jgi:hypothetical protein